MINITILTIGKIKENYFSQAANEYLKRLSPYAKIRVEELKAESFNESNKDKAKNIEGERIIFFLEKRPDSEIFILDEKGKEFTSVEFSKEIGDESHHFIFVIGGSLGLSEEVKKKGKNISLSKMTYPHEMARMILIEQIYRAVTIVKGKQYHY